MQHNSANKIKDTIEKEKYKVGDLVQLKIIAKTDLGYKAIVDGQYYGVLYYNEVFEDVRVDDELEGYIKLIREDLRIDLTLYKAGSKGSDEIAERILDALKKAGGILPINAKTTPEYIYQNFGVSKKKFKMALGGLYKKRLIEIRDNEIKLIQQK